VRAFAFRCMVYVTLENIMRSFIITDVLKHICNFFLAYRREIT
jgi:hypothetical protein